MNSMGRVPWSSNGGFGLTVAKNTLWSSTLTFGRWKCTGDVGRVLEGGSGFSTALGMDIPVDLPDSGSIFFPATPLR